MQDDELPETRTVTFSQIRLLAIIAALTVGSLAYRLITQHHLEQSALLFIGLPGLLAAVLALVPPAKSITGGILRGITLFLLMSGPLLGEGFVCILMAAPIFLAVGLVVGLCMQYTQNKRRVTLSCCLLVLIPMSLEGTNPSLSFNRIDRASSTAVVEGTPEEVQERLSHSPRLDLKLPVYLRLGFPRPTLATGEGNAPGDRRTIHFAGGEGMPEDIVFQVVSAAPNEIHFTVVHDGDNMMHTLSHWVGLREAEVTWQPVDATHTRVTWEIAYERRLDPAWYFGPWERYAGRVAAKYLIDANAGPR